MLTRLGKPPRAGRTTVFLALGLLLGARPAAAQQLESNLPLPRLNTVFPCGGKAGTTVEVTVTGTDLDEPEGLVFSHPGLQAQPVAAAGKTPTPPPDPRQKRRGGMGVPG